MTTSSSWTLGLALLVLCASAVPAIGDDDPGARISRGLRTRLENAGRSEEIAVNVVLRDSGLPGRDQGASRRRQIRSRQQAVLDGLPQGYRLGHRYDAVNGFSLRATPQVIDALSRHPDTQLVYLDGRVRGVLAQGRVLVGADHAHAVGVTGAGVKVAVLDSGIDTDHPDLFGHFSNEQCWCSGASGVFGCCPNGFDTDTGSGSAEDGGGHGTKVSGVITSPDGVAPDAVIIPLKVLDSAGDGSFSDVDAALGWVVANHAALGIRVVNLSLGDGAEYTNPLVEPCSGSNTANLVATLRSQGVATFAASGNDGHDNGVSFPACIPDAISVGGVYDAALGTVSWCGETCGTTVCTDTGTAADEFVCHSNSDATLDLLAPDWRTRTTEVGGGTASVGGTSMATPYAGALAALIVEQDPSRTVAEIESLMTSNGPMVTNPDNALAFPRADVEAVFAVCGDSATQVGEDCDDGNVVDGDCCSATCEFEVAGSGCDDANACTTPDTCDGAGLCVAPVLDCDDLVFCNGIESCDSGLGCQAGVPPSVDDGVACTVDSCDELNDVVVHTPDHVSCADGEFCNGVELCDLLSDCQPGPPPSIDDGIACTIDSCDEQAQQSVHVPDDLACDDADPCTAESCDELLGCVTTSTSLCPKGVPTSGPAGLVFMALTLALFGSAWLGLAGRIQCQSPGDHR